MKKHLSKIVLTALLVLAIASSMIFAGLITEVPTYKVEVLYTLGTEKPVIAFMLEDASITLTEKEISNAVLDRLNASAVTVNGTEVDVDGTKYELVIFGDLNKDGKINVFDTVALLNAFYDVENPLEGTDLLRANIANTDNTLNVFDVMRLLNLYVGNSTEVLAKPYTNELVIENYSLEADKLVLELNMHTDFLTMAFTNMSTTLEETINVENATVDSVAYVDNTIEVNFTDLDNGTYTVQIVDDNNDMSIAEIYAEQEFEYNKLTISELKLYKEDGLTELTTAMGKDIEKIDAIATFEGTVDGSFSLEFKVYDDVTLREEENLVAPATIVSGGKYDNNTKKVTFDNVDVTKLPDGYVVVTLKYVSGKYEVSLELTAIQKLTTALEVVSAEINRTDDATVSQEKTTLSLLLELKEDVSANAVTAKALLLAYENDKAPATPEVDELKAHGDVENLTFTENASNIILSSDYEVAGTTLQNADAKYKLFVVLTDGINETDVLAYDIPEFGATALKPVLQVVLGENSVASWTPDATETGTVTGYRVYLYKGSDVVYTEVVTGTSVDLIEQIKAEDTVSGNEFKVEVVAIGDGVESLNSLAKESNVVEVEELTLGTVEFVADPENSTELTITYEMTKEELEAILENVEGLEIDVCEKGAIDVENDNPRGIVETVGMTFPAIEEEEKDVKYVASLELMDLVDCLANDGEYTVYVRLLAKRDTKYLDVESSEIGTYYNASIKSVETKVDHESAKIIVTSETAPVGALVNVSYLDKNGGTVSIPNQAIGEIALTNIVAGTEYSIKVELVKGNAVLDTVENVKVKLDDKRTLTTDNILEVGTTFAINKTKVTFGNETLELDEVANKDFLVAVYEMLLDGDKFKINEEGNGIIGVAFLETDDSSDAKVTTRTVSLDKKLLSEETIIDIVGGSNIETLILKGTANDLVFEATVLIDIQGLSAGVMNISNPYVLRLEGTAEYDPSALVEDTVSAPVKAFTTFTVEGYTHVFTVDYDTEISLCEGFLTTY